MKVSNDKNDRFGRRYYFDRLWVQRNNPVTFGKNGRYFIEVGNSSWTSLTDEEMEEFFMAWQVMRKEYEDRKEVEL